MISVSLLTMTISLFLMTAEHCCQHASASKSEPVFDLTLEERINLEKSEPALRKAVKDAIADFGEISREKATALQKLGGVLYKLEKYAGLLSTAKEIIRIETELGGPQSKQLAVAMRNAGSVAYRMGMKDESLRYMMRSLNILLHHFEEDSYDVLYHKSIMLSFEQESDYLEYPLGMTHEQFMKTENQYEFEFAINEL